MRQNRVIVKFLGITLVCLMLGSMFGAFPSITYAATKFNIGDTVEVTTNLNVRTGPGTSYPEINDPDYPGYAPAGTQGQVLDGPTSADGYIWWKVDYGPGLYSGWSVEGGLEKVVQPPPAPTITSPGSASEPGPTIDTLTPTLQWNTVSGADYYALAISKYPYGTGNIIYNPQQLTGTSHVVPSGTLVAGEKYRWNMQAHGPGGWSGVSNTLYFQSPPPTQQPPPAPTITSPGSASEPGPTIDTLTPTLQWNTVSGADYYALAISKYPYGTGNIIYNPQQLTGTSHVVPSGTLVAGEKYRWNMQAHNNAGWSAVSNTLYFQTTGVQKPDLVIKGITWSPTSPSIGETVTFTVTIKNQGSSKAASSKVYYFIDNVQQAYDYVSSLDPDTTTTETFTWKAQEGQHPVKVMVDYEEVITESDETNNEKTITFSATALSDLIIESVMWLPISSSIGDTVTFTVTIKNQGSGRADSSKVYYFIDEVQQGYDSVYSLDPNETATETFTWDAEEGSHTVMAVADYNDEVVEINETNNETTVSFSLAMEVVSTPRMPSGPTTGTTGTSYSYSTGGASSSYGHSIEYRYDWGDGSYSSWSASTSASHSWTTEGPYTVRAQARCALHTDVVSDWSSGLVVNAKTSQIVSAEIVGYDAVPRDPEVGSTVKLTLSFINTGNTAWTFYAAASLRKPNGTEEHLPLEPVSLDPNQQGSAAWTYKLDMEGKWDVVFGIWQASDQRNTLARTEWLRGYINAINIDEIRNNINFKLQQRVTYPPYLLDPDSFATAVTTAWLTVTKPLTGDLPGRYDEFYSAGIDYDCLKYNTLVKARDMLNRGDIASAEEYLRRANTYEKLSNMSFEAATDVFIGNLESAEILARGIKDGCEASVKLGLAVINPKAAKVADYLYIGIDYAIERLIGEEDAAKNALVKAAVTTIFNQVKFKQFDNRTIADYTRNRVGKVTFPMLQDAFRSEEVQFALSKIIKESVVEIEEQVAEDMAQYILDELKKVVNFEQITVKSPVELRVYDSQDQVTGLIGGTVKHDIPRAMYDKGTVTVFFPVGSYRYEVAGVDAGTYGLEVVSVEDKRSNTLHLTDIPTSSKTMHEYTFDWTALTQGEKGVTMKIDSDGDGSFERVINLSGIEEEKEGLPVWAWICIGVIMGLAIAFVVWRRMGKKQVARR